ncbi:hypothetical protein PENSPDRAFT_635186 [Peniophora sp. CONT]|nr:hypothetical protein PENSPDRAFT_635186 [Peniophora sp. CONT]
MNPLLSGLRSALRQRTDTVLLRTLSSTAASSSNSSPRRLARRSQPVKSENADLEIDGETVGAEEQSQRPASWRPMLPPTPDEWRVHHAKMKKDFPQGWAPPRKLSRDAMDALRDLHTTDPTAFTTEVLADRFQVSPEAVRRILRSRWAPSDQRRQLLLAREKKMRDEALMRRQAKEQDDVAEIEKEMEDYIATYGPLQTDEAPRRRRREDDRLTMT